MSDTHALGTPRAPSVVGFLNPLIQRLLRVGMPFGPNVLLTVRGRTSGIPRTFPVAILEFEGRRFVQSPFGEVNWVHNLRAAREAVITKGRDQEPVDATELTPAEAGPILEDGLGPFLRGRVTSRFVGRFFHLRRDSTPEEFVEAARIHPMFELRPRQEAVEEAHTASRAG